MEESLKNRKNLKTIKKWDVVTDGVRQGHILVKKIGFIKPVTEREKHGVRADEERWRGGGKFFQISFFFFIGVPA